MISLFVNVAISGYCCSYIIIIIIIIIIIVTIFVRCLVIFYSVFLS